MADCSEMEVEAMPQQRSEGNETKDSLKRFGLKNSIQTNFGDDYVFQIVPRSDWHSMAVSLSSKSVKLYSPVTGQYQGECKGHSGTINQIGFCHAAPAVLSSCSSDGTIRTWDTRTFQQVSRINTGMDQEIFSFAFGGSSDNLVAGGCNSQVIFWDWRNGKQVACLEESHTDDVTQVHFVPNKPNRLVSASADGLICVFDTEGDINDDDHLESVLNVGTSVGKVGFFGGSYQKLWCLTHIETLSVWDWQEGRCEANLENSRSLASESWNLDNIDYFVDCLHAGDDNLWVIAGTNAGTLGYLPVSYRDGGSIGPPEAVLGGGHIGVVRSVLPMPSVRSGFTAGTRGVFGWTGGEDGRLCCWTSDESVETNRAWISTALVIKSPKMHRRNRHHPY